MFYFLSASQMLAGKCCYSCIFCTLEKWLLHLPSTSPHEQTVLYEGCIFLLGMVCCVVIVGLWSRLLVNSLVSTKVPPHEENYLWHIGRFHRAHMAQSILWIMIGWTIWLDMLVHKYKPSVQLKLVSVLCICWTSGKCCRYYHYCCVLLPSTVLLFILQ